MDSYFRNLENLISGDCLSRRQPLLRASYPALFGTVSLESASTVTST
jgi:hypothetical protein